MPTSPNSSPDLTEIITDLRRRVARVETYAVAALRSPDPTSPILADLTVTGLSASTVNRYTDPVTNDPRVAVTWTWTSIATTTNDDPTFDLPQKYQVSFTTANTPAIDNWVDVSGPAYTRDNLPLNTVVALKVRAIAWSGRVGPVATSSVNTNKDTTPPAQPSTPVVTPALKGVRISWDGKNSSNAAMDVDLLNVQVHASTAGPTFVPGPSTFQGFSFPPGGGVYTVITPDYNTWYVRLVAVDTSGNSSPASTAGSATPAKAVDTDMGIALPGDIAYRDEGNLLLDGSFESPLVRTDRATNGSPTNANVAFGNTANFAAHGSWYLAIAGDAIINKSIWLVNQSMANADEIPVGIYTNAKLYISTKIRGISANGSASVVLRWTDASGGQALQTIIITSSATGSYVNFEAVTAIPTNAVSLNVQLLTNNQTAGVWYFDSVQIRNIVGTALIEDAAITNAKIQDLAVNNAKITDLSAGKITTGSIAAGQEIIAGDPATSSSRMTATGFYVYSADDQDGIPNLAVRLGTAENDMFAIVNAAGDTVGSWDDTGAISASELDIDDEITIRGEVLLGIDGANKLVDYNISGRDLENFPIGILEGYAQGVISRAYWYTSSFDKICNSGQTYHLLNIGADCLPGRSYSIRVSPLQVNVTNIAATNAYGRMDIRRTLDGGDPNTSTPIVQQVFIHPKDGGWISFPGFEHRFDNTATTVVDARFGICINASQLSLDIVSSGVIFYCWITDEGPISAQTGTLINSTAGGTPPSTVKSYTKTYTSNGWASYRSKNALLRGDANGPGDTNSRIYQGYSSSGSYNGDQRGLWTFPSITADVGSGTITKVEAYIYFDHWYNNSGGTALIKVHGYLDNGWPTGSLPTLTTAKSVASWPKPGGKWVTLPSSLYAGFKSGTYRGFGIGPAGSTSTTYYGYASPTAYLRVTYQK